MKLRKTRICVETKANGSVWYTAEYKYGWWWTTFNDLHSDLNVFNIAIEWVDEVDIVDGSEQQAKSLIDFYIRHCKYEQACKIENKVVKTAYESYP